MCWVVSMDRRCQLFTKNRQITKGIKITLFDEKNSFHYLIILGYYKKCNSPHMLRIQSSHWECQCQTGIYNQKKSDVINLSPVLNFLHASIGSCSWSSDALSLKRKHPLFLLKKKFTPHAWKISACHGWHQWWGELW